MLHNFHFKSHHSYLLSTTCYNLLKKRVIIFFYISKKRKKEKKKKKRENEIEISSYIIIAKSVTYIYGMLHNFHFKSYHSYFIRKKRESYHSYLLSTILAIISLNKRVIIFVFLKLIVIILIY